MKSGATKRHNGRVPATVTPAAVLTVTEPIDKDEQEGILQ